MSTTPVIVVPSVAKAESWLKTHERLIGGVLLLLVALYLTRLYINRSADEADAKVKVAQTVASQQAAADSVLADQVKQATAQYATLVAQLTAQNQQLTTAIATRSQAVIVQQARDATLTPAATAARISTQTDTKPTDTTAQGNNVVLAPDAAHAVVQQMDELAAAQQNLTDTQTIVADDQKQIFSLTGINTDLTTQVAGLKLEVTDGTKLCDATVSDVKAKARKSKMRWFGVGYVAGFGSAVALFVTKL